VDLVQRARELYAAGRLHDALEAAQAACDRAPKDPEAWRLLGRVSRHTGMPAASDEAFRRAAELCARRAVPPRVSLRRFQDLVDDAREALPRDVRGRLAGVSIRIQPLPSADQIRSGLSPDALTLRLRQPEDVLVIFQANHENACDSEAKLAELVRRSLAAI
jgi:tetratricopeptide (TPR) repeat protein